MEINNLANLEKRLFSEIGKEQVEKVVDDLIKIITANNLDVTPTTLSEVLDYTKGILILRGKPSDYSTNLATEVIKNLGFDKDQANRFETMANNPDVVEQVKAEARENDDLPTRSRVLQLVKEKKKAAKEQEVSKMMCCAMDYAKKRGYPYKLILSLCHRGMIPSIKLQRYMIDPDEADAALEKIKNAPKVEVKEKPATTIKTQKCKMSFLDRLSAIQKAQ